jgi:hypothetical protein
MLLVVHLGPHIFFSCCNIFIPPGGPPTSRQKHKAIVLQGFLSKLQLVVVEGVGAGWWWRVVVEGGGGGWWWRVVVEVVVVEGGGGGGGGSNSSTGLTWRLRRASSSTTLA